MIVRTDAGRNVFRWDRDLDTVRQRGERPCHQHRSCKGRIFGLEGESLAHEPVGYELDELARDDIGVGW